MRMVLLGAPGAGKGTQCKRMVERYGVRHLSSGDILRQQRADKTELGSKAQSFMDTGALVPDDIIVEMMVDAIEKAGGVGFVLDGFPRTVNQARELDKSLFSHNGEIDIVINLQIGDDEVIRRMAGRRSCPRCGSVYHLENLRPKVNGVCDKDGAELIQRSDDKADVVANRLRTYHEQTRPVVDYYRAKDILYDVDGGKVPDEVTATVFERLDTLVKTSP